MKKALFLLVAGIFLIIPAAVFGINPFSNGNFLNTLQPPAIPNVNTIVREAVNGSMGNVLDELQVFKQPSTPAGTDDLLSLIVKARNQGKQDAVLKKFGLTRSEAGDTPATAVVVAPKMVAVEQLLRVLQNDPDVEYAEPNFILKASFIPNDPYYNPYQWNFKNVGAESAWDVTQGGGVVVAVVDTGVAYENYQSKYKVAPDLVGTSFVSGYDYVRKDSHPNDENGHGTHVAGTIAQATNNASGAAGLAYKATIMPVRVLDQYGSGYTSWIASGIRYAADKGAKVINLSLGGAGSQTLKDAVNYALGKGVIVVAASGNESASVVTYPAAYPGVIAVGAVGFDNVRSPYSNYGSALTLVAPGGDMNEDLNGDGYPDGILQQTLVQKCWYFGCYGDTKNFGWYFFQGTSMATPHVSAAAAMLIANGTPASQIKQKLSDSATDLGPTGFDSEYGYGLLNIEKALQ